MSSFANALSNYINAVEMYNLMSKYTILEKNRIAACTAGYYKRIEETIYMIVNNADVLCNKEGIISLESSSKRVEILKRAEKMIHVDEYIENMDKIKSDFAPSKERLDLCEMDVLEARNTLIREYSYDGAIKESLDKLFEAININK